MNKKNISTTIIFILLILTVLAIGSYVYIGQKQQNPIIPIPAQTNSNIVTYYCDNGIIKAEYGDNGVSLSLKDGRNITLPQTISGSGIRYELGTTTFSSKGDNAFLTENNIQTYSNCVSGNQTTNQDINTYTNSSKTFSFSYPNKFILSGGDIGYSQDWAIGSSNLGILLTVVKIPQSFLPKTNFGDAKFTVGTSADPDAIKNCLTPNDGNTGTTSEVLINSRKFTKTEFTDVGAGNYYDTTSYRTLYNDQCYSIEYTIHSTNIFNYSPDQGIKEFNKTDITLILENIARSFKFI